MAAFLVLIFFPAIMSLGFMIAYMMIKAFRPGQVNSILSAKGGWLYFAMLLLPAGLVCWQTFRTSTWQDTGFRLPDLMGLHEGFTVFFATIAAVILGYLLYFNELFLTYQVTQRIRSVNKRHAGRWKVRPQRSPRIR